VADVLQLFEEYAGAYGRGERPEAQEYLERAGDGADELAHLIDGWLRAVPVPEPDANTIALVSAWMEEEPPLVHVRASKGVRVDEVVDAIVGDAGLTKAQAPKVKSYYQRLEEGLLDPRGVSERVWQTLRRVIGPAARTAAAWRLRPTTLEPAFYRATGTTMLDAAAADAMDAIPPMPERDEVYELFTAAP
jgi:hypothetical protein